MIYGHENTIKQLMDLKPEKLSSAYSFLGVQGLGKFLVASKFARKVLCDNFEPCEKCPNCLTKNLGNHPDYVVLPDEDERKSIKIEEIREVTQKLSLRPYKAKRKVCVLDNFDLATHDAQNSFLKTLEEPSGQTTIILIIEKMENILPTILSRCQVIKFLPFSKSEMLEFAKQNRIDINNELDIINLSFGRPGRLLNFSKNKETIADLRELVGAKSISEIFSKIKNLNDDKVNEVLDNLLAIKYTENSRRKSNNIEKILEYKKLAKANVSKKLLLENLLLELIEK